MKLTVNQLRRIIKEETQKMLNENDSPKFSVGDYVEYDGSYDDDVPERGVVEEVDEDGLLVVRADENRPGEGTYREWDASTCKLVSQPSTSSLRRRGRR